MKIIYSSDTGNASNIKVENNSVVDYFGTFQTGLFGTWLVLIIIAAIIGNLMVIIVILRSKRMRAAKNGTNLFLLNLAISDLMVGLCAAPISLNTLVHEEWQFPDWFCSLNSFLNTLFLLASIHLLMYISIHKYISIRRHSKANPQPVSLKKCALMIAAAWTWGFLFAILTVTGLSKAEYRPKKIQCGPRYPKFTPKLASLFFGNFVLNILIPMLIMGITYRRIFSILHQSTLFRRKSNVGTQDAIRSEKGATKTLVLVLTVFMLCWLPYVIYSYYALLVTNKNDVPSFLNPLAYCSGFTNSICNPVIYAFRFEDFRSGYRNIFRRSSYFSKGVPRLSRFKPNRKTQEQSKSVE